MHLWHCVSAEFNPFVPIYRCNVALHSKQLLAPTREKNVNAKVTEVQRWTQRAQEADQSGKKPLSSAIHLARLVQGILMGFLQVPPHYTWFPQWECFLPTAEQGCANFGDIQVSGPWLLPSSDVGGAGTIWGRHHNQLLEEKKKKRLYSPRGYMLGAGCNCFPHFLGLVKLIHYQRQAGVPKACQWACFLRALWHFLPCNSKQKAIKPVINWCILGLKIIVRLQTFSNMIASFLFKVLT